MVFPGKSRRVLGEKQLGFGPNGPAPYFILFCFVLVWFVLFCTENAPLLQSYYGETNLHFLKADGSHEGNVPLGKEGPIHDVQWAPDGEVFVAVRAPGGVSDTWRLRDTEWSQPFSYISLFTRNG
eukprot:543413-Pyramimonas_sp.AAC.2